MRVAVIGLGVMGAGMARHLAGRGHSVTGYNRTRSRADALAPHGVAVAGTPREGARLKLANNLLGANLVAALAETLALVAGSGIDPALYARVLAETNLGTRMLAGKAKQMVEGDYKARFSVANEGKDVGLALTLARELDLRLHQGESVRHPF